MFLEKMYICWGKLVLELEEWWGETCPHCCWQTWGALPMLSCLSFASLGSRGPLTPILIISFSPDHEVMSVTGKLEI